MLQKFSEFAELLERSDDLQNVQQPVAPKKTHVQMILISKPLRYDTL